MSDEKMTGRKVVDILFATFILFPIVCCVSLLTTGWAIKTGWGWFAVPLGAMQITLFHACGIRLLLFIILDIHYLIIATNKEEYDGGSLSWFMIRGLSKTIGVTLMLVGAGYVLHKFM